VRVTPTTVTAPESRICSATSRPRGRIERHVGALAEPGIVLLQHAAIGDEHDRDRRFVLEPQLAGRDKIERAARRSVAADLHEARCATCGSS
jgi:hypothetical protein